MRKLFKWTEKLVRWSYCFVEGFVALVVVLGGIAFWRLYTEPMDAEFLLPEVSKRLFPEGTNYTVEIKSSQLYAAPNENGLFHLNVKDFKVLRPDKKVALALPELNLSYGFWHIVTLNYTPNTLEIVKPYLRLIIDEKGQWSFQGNPDSSTTEVLEESKLPEVRRIVNHILSFDALRITNGHVKIEDLMLKQRLSIPKFSLVLGRRFHISHRASFKGVLRIDDDLIDVEARGKYNDLTKNLEFEAGIPKLLLSRFERFFPILGGIKFPVSFSISSNFNLRKKTKNFANCLTNLKFQVKSLGGGKLHLPSPIKNTYDVESLEINGAASEGFQKVKIAKSSATLRGGINADLEVKVAGLDKFFDSLNLKDINTTLDAVVKNVAMSDVPKVWPSEQGPDAHYWVRTHLSQGKVSEAKFRLFFEGGDLVDLFGDVRAKGVRVDYLPPMAAVNDVSAQVLLYPDKVHIIADDGNIHDLKLKSADLKFYDLDKDNSWTEMSLNIEGPIQQALHLIESKPLELIQQFNIPVDKLSGSGTTKVYLKFPLLDDLSIDQLQVKVDADVENLAFKTGDPNLKIDQGQFNLKVANEGLVLDGNIKVMGQPMKLTWNESFLNTAEIFTTYEIKTENFKTNALKTVIPDFGKYITGAVNGNIKVAKNNQNKWNGVANINLTNAQVVLYPVSLTKPAEKECVLNLNAQNISDNFNQGTLVADMKGSFSKDKPLDIQGKFVWGKGWRLILDKVLAADNNFKGEVADSAESFELKLHGSKWDISDLFEVPVLKQKTVKSQTKPDVVQNILLDVDLGALVVNKSYPLKQLQLKGNRNQKLWQNFHLQAEASKPFVVTYIPKTKKFEGSFGDFGALMQYLFAVDRFKDGVVSLEATQDSEGLIKGEISVDKIIVKDPGFLLQAATILGIVDAFRGKDIEMDEVSIPFTLDAWHHVTLQDGYAAGSTIGVTVKGSLSLQELDLSGSVIPAYMVNSLPGKIPLLGALFRSEEGGGLIGVKYSVDGIPTNPEVHFHPLSSVLPGALGRVF